MRTPDPVALTAAVTTALPSGPPMGTPVPPPDSPYWLFYDEVAAAQVADWLPQSRQRVLDVSGSHRFAEGVAALGHQVVQVLPDLATAREACGSQVPVVGDLRSLGWVRDGSMDLVLAESRALSLCLATEVTVEHLVRVLRPGGRLLLTVESLLLGLARLAEQGRWAELADAPSADVVLVPRPDGRLSRCFWPEELSTLLTDAGLEVDWVRPRTVLSPATVERALTTGGGAALRSLVATEVTLAAEREGESTGLHLLASARRHG